jgi:peptide/nickel transport system permease protein
MVVAEILRLIGRRLLFAVPVVLGITLYVFLVIQFSPADPRFATLGIFASEEQRAQFAEEYHLDDPLLVRYPQFLGDLVQGDLGVTTRGIPVTSVLGEALPVTLGITLLALIGALAFAFLLGVSSAYYAGSWWDSVVRAVSFASLAMPVFWLAILSIQVFAVHWQWFPAGGYTPPSESIEDWLASLVLPGTVLALTVGGFLTRVVRSAVLDELDQDYVRTARGLGLRDRTILLRNVLRNAAASPLTVIGLQIGYLLSGAVLVEVVFNLPGLGLLLYTSARNGDIAVIVGIALVAAITFVVVNLLTDIAYLIANPRARES